VDKTFPERKIVVTRFAEAMGSAEGLEDAGGGAPEVTVS
jgi:hypothetical protein